MRKCSKRQNIGFPQCAVNIHQVSWPKQVCLSGKNFRYYGKPEYFGIWINRIAVFAERFWLKLNLCATVPDHCPSTRPFLICCDIFCTARWKICHRLLYFEEITIDQQTYLFLRDFCWKFWFFSAPFCCMCEQFLTSENWAPMC